MTLDKLPSGKYRIRQMIDGKRYTVILDHRPTQVEISRIITEMANRAPKSQKGMTVLSASEAYIASKSNVLSPSTIRNYRGQIKAISDDFKGLYINAVTSAMLQTEVNRYAKNRTPKTVSNFAHFLTAVFYFYDVDIKAPKLPQAVKTQKYIPTLDEVKAIIEEVKDTKYEIFYRLAMFGLRRSETFALSLSDLSDDNYLTISKALVLNDKREKVIKTTKTTDSTRTIKIDAELADKIRAQGYVWEGSMDMPYIRLCQVQDKLGIQHFPLHAFRHLMASFLHDKGLSDKQIQEIGGWKTDRIMKAVYEHAMNMDDVKQSVSDMISDIWS